MYSMIEKPELKITELRTGLFLINDSDMSNVSIPAPIEPPVRSLGAALPAAQSHPSGGGNHHSGTRKS